MIKPVYILGISAFYHDSAACILRNETIIAAAQEERFTRKKNDSRFPKMAINYCLKEAGIEAHEITKVVFYEKPFLKFERILETYFAFAPKGIQSFAKSMPEWIKNKLFQKKILIDELKKLSDKKVDWRARLLFSEHHLSHAASAFFPSPFDRAAILVLDGVGEWTTTSVAVGNGNQLRSIKKINFPHSVGLLYSAFTYYTGFKVNSGEYKMMGLAPYGQPIYANLIEQNLIKIAEDGSFRLDMSYFNFATGLTMTNKRFHLLFGGPPREKDEEITQRHMDIAASIQTVVEKLIVNLAKHVASETKEKNLCLAGGVALNCVANGLIVRKKIFNKVWVQPASGDAGGALGAALAVWHMHYGEERNTAYGNDRMGGSYLGPRFSNEEIETQFRSCGAIFQKLNEEELISVVVEAIIQGQVIGWMQGRMEFGPRALGNRSIIADPRIEEMQEKLNLKIKFREGFRPFAPSVISEHASDWFDLDCESPYMLFVSEIHEDKRLCQETDNQKSTGFESLKIRRSTVPAVTHIDYTARVQTVSEASNPKFFKLITHFMNMTGCPMLINTSFNLRAEPIVCDPTDAFKCFLKTDIDLLVVENFLLKKADQKPLERC
ncbi:MAG: carbamoyltransferase [Alphaproteobacteria bacterium]